METRRATVATIAGLAVLAFVVRLVGVLRGGGLNGIIDYDDAVYFGSAVALVHGLIPYRDFLLLHPPGILYVLAPFAALGTIVGDGTAFALARLAFMVLGAVNTVLVALVARQLGRREAIFAAALYAVWVVPATVERTTWLIGPQNMLLLLALLVLAPRNDRSEPAVAEPRRAAAAGVLLGLAIAMQLWQVVVFAVVLTWIVIASRRASGTWLRPALAYTAGAALALGIAGLPFLVASGGQMLRYIVLDQLGRPGDTFSFMARLQTIEGLPGRGSLARAIPDAPVIAAFLATGMAVAIVAWRRRAVRPWAALLGVQTVVLLMGPVFFGHYKGWIAPAAALSIGAAAATIVGAVTVPGWRVAARVAYVFALAVLLVPTLAHAEGTRFPLAALNGVVANARCVTSDSPVLLIETGALTRDLDAHCPLKLDPTGTSYDSDRSLVGRQRSRHNMPEYQHAMAAYYGGSDAALFIRLSTGDGFTGATWAAMRSELPLETKVGPITVLRRSAAPP
jgi:alpha-1,2-mannosyltransferase